uniref:Uncharacterized protein n=1 Tax=Clytia hemisphaerica TaxID=252671 RepID=A0A7M5WWF6_9CNID
MRLLIVQFLVILGCLYVQHVDSHAAMLEPLSWLEFKQWIQMQDGSWVFDYVGTKSRKQCLAGENIPKNVICNGKYTCEDFKSPGLTCFWYKNNTRITEPTIFDPELRTYPHAPNQDEILTHPWRAPGTAPIDSPCGVAGGNINGCIGGKCSQNRGGFGFGPKLVDVNMPYDFVVTEWVRDTVVEVIWGIFANHGGGYSYRLCKLPEEGYSKLTEECFQQIPLEFIGDKQWIQYGEDKTSRVEIEATRVTKGTYPEGSQWTKNPIPGCIGDYGGFLSNTTGCPHGTQFKPQKTDLYGYGVRRYFHLQHFPFSIVDLVHIPSDLPAGEYVLSFRWDAEQSPQVWNSCASINIV